MMRKAVLFRWEPREQTGFSFVRAQSHHRTGIDRHPMRPNNLVTLRAFRWALCIFWPVPE